eukprot:jgi/Tetstr1/447229/TSEL_034666.t1
METVVVAADVFRILSDLHGTHIKVREKVKSLKNLIEVFLEFMHCRINTHNMVSAGLSEKIHANLRDMREEIRRYDLESASCFGKLYCMSGLGGTFFGSRRFLDRLTSYEQDMTQFLTFVKIDLTTNTNDAIFNSNGLYREQDETPKLFWHARFPDKSEVPTDTFCQALQGRARCSFSVGNHIASTLSTDGVVYATTFFGGFDDSEGLVNMKKWVEDRQMFGESRTVLIPAHVNYITKMEVHGDNVVTASKDCTLKVFSINDTTIILKCVMVGHEGSVKDFFVRDDTIFSGSIDGSIRAWEMEEGAQMRCFQVGVPVYSVSPLSDRPSVLVFSTRDRAYPIIFYDMDVGRAVKKIRLDVRNITNFVVRESLIYISDSSHVRVLDMSGGAVSKHVCQKPVVCMHVSSVGIVFDTGQGVCILKDENAREEQINLIESPSPLFRVYAIKEFAGSLFVLWTYGNDPTQTRITNVDLDDMSFDTHVINPRSDAYMTNLTFYGNRVYFSTLTGNLCWYDLNNLKNDICDGYTFNDQIVMGLGFEGVRVATCPNGIIVSNKNELRLWNNETGAITSVRLPFAAVDCVYSDGNVHVFNGTTLYVYDMDLNLVDTYNCGWQIEKVLISNGKVMVLYSEASRVSQEFYREFSTKNIARFENGQFTTIPGLCPNTVLFSTKHNVFLSDSNHITVIDANTLALRFKTDFYSHATGIAISGCILEDRCYTLHFCNKVLVWTKGFMELNLVYKYDVHESIVDIKDFSGHIIGFSTLGTIYVYDGNMNLQKCIVSHQARLIYGASYNDNKEVVVSDTTGVLKVLAELFSQN